MRPLQKTGEYKGPEPPAWTLPGLVEGAVGAARAASSSYAGLYPEERAEVLRREEARKRFARLAEKAKALRDTARTEPQRELASKLLIATRLGIGGQHEEAERAIDDAQKRYSEVI